MQVLVHFFFKVVRFTTLGSQYLSELNHRAINSQLPICQSSSLYSFNIWIYNKAILFFKKCLLKATWECLQAPCSFFGLLESEGVSNESPVVPSVQHFLSGVIVHHGVVAILVYKRYLRVPLFSCLGVISKVDSGGISVILVNTVDYSTGYKSIAHGTLCFCKKRGRLALDKWIVRKSVTPPSCTQIRKSFLEYDSEWNTTLVFHWETKYIDLAKPKIGAGVFFPHTTSLGQD